MKFSISFKYSNVTFKNKETKETVTYDTKAETGNTFTFDNVDEDVVLGIVKGIKDRKASQVFSYDDLRTNFVNVMARNKCKELYDKLDKGEWKVEDVAISNVTIRDLEFTKPTMNARETLTVESKRKQVAENIYGNKIDEALNLLNEAAASLHMAMWDIKKELGQDNELFNRVERNYNDVHETYGIMEKTMNKTKMNESVDTYPVIFKKDRSGEVVAFFPETAKDGSCNRGNIMCYAHVGQHSEASLDYFWSCKPCSEEEYAPLLKELQGIYDDVTLVVKRRLSRESVNDAAYALDDPEYADDGHDYVLELANGRKKIVDPTKYEGWADVVEFGSEYYPNTVIVSDDEDSAVGLVLSERDHIEIVKVTDPATKEVWEIGTDKTPRQWAKDCVWCYDDKYV